MKSKNISWNDLLFKNRNKAYGAYDLRESENFNLLKSLFTGLFAIGAMVLILSFTINKERVIEKPKDPTIIKLTKIPPDVAKPEKQAAATPPKIKVIEDKIIPKDILPDPKDKPANETPVKDNIDLGTLIMPKNGNVGTTGSDNSTPNSQSTGTGTTPVTKPEKNENIIYNSRNVEYMAVYPGCEKVGKDKLALQNCMAKNLQKELISQLGDFSEFAVTNNIDEANAKLIFVVNKKGKIIQVNAQKGGNEQLSSEAKKALERIAERLVQKGKFIQPAKLNDGTEVNIKLSIPVKYVTL